MRRTVGILLALTLIVLLVDLARPGWTEPIRSAAAVVVAPVQQVVRGWGEDDLDRARAERDRMAIEAERLRAELDAMRRADRIRPPEGFEEQDLVSARVVGLAPPTSPVGTVQVTIDAGSRVGVRADQSVLDADGLVGRVLRVNGSSAEVLVLGDPDVVVGVRFGADGALGSLGATADPSLPRRDPGELTLTGIGDAEIQVGDRVATLGSPDSTPFAADIPVGTVTEVDPDTGQLGRTAVVVPSVDTDTLDAVVVLTPGAQP